MASRVSVADMEILLGPGQESTSCPVPQVTIEETTASQKVFIEQIVEAKHGEGLDTFDLYKVLYFVHHQFKKLPLGHIKVPKF